VCLQHQARLWASVRKLPPRQEQPFVTLHAVRISLDRSQPLISIALFITLVIYNAYLLAMSLGDVDELCDPNGDSFAAIDACAKCISQNENDSYRGLPAELRQINFICAGSLEFTTDTFLMPDGKTSTITHLVNVSSTNIIPWTTVQSASGTSAPAVTSSAAASGSGSSMLSSFPSFLTNCK
jgi:hypothetical protein